MSIKNGKQESRVVESFRQAYAEIHEAADLASEMSQDGNATEFLRSDVQRLIDLTRNAACRANAILGVHDGKFEVSEGH